MAFVITDPCIGTKDASCVEVCPVDCIHSDEDAPQYYIDPETCISCGACQPVCPVQAIYDADSDLPESMKDAIRVNAEYYTK